MAAPRSRGKRVLCIEDGPTLTHGEMTYGAAVLAAQRSARQRSSIRGPSRSARSRRRSGPIPDIGTLLPAMGYGREQMEELRETIYRSDADLVLIGTPIDLRRIIDLDKPALRVTYRLDEIGAPLADRRSCRARPPRITSRRSLSTVIALGGNALVRAGQRGTAAEQAANLRETAAALEPLLAEPELVVTHGNGPQVGNELLRQERAADEVPPLPLYLAVAQTQAEIGALIEAELGAISTRSVTCVLTHVQVDPDDAAFADPTKPIGPFYSEQQARALEQERGWQLVSDSGRGWRRVVPSPTPLEIVELEAIRMLAHAGTIVVACGGGGIPVAAHEHALRGIDAVIDKDRASALLATRLEATRLVILTGVSAVKRGFGTAREETIEELSADEADLLAPELAAGSMRPKVEASATFARATGGEALITSAEELAAALDDRAGTRIHP